MKKQVEDGNGNGKEPAPSRASGSSEKIEERGEAVPWMPEGWWSPLQCLDRKGRQITVWRCVRGADGADETLQPQVYLGHGTRAEKFNDGMVGIQPLEFVIEAASFAEACEKYDGCLAEAGERVGEEMRKEYTRQKLMLPSGPPGHSGTFNRLKQRPRF